MTAEEEAMFADAQKLLAEQTEHMKAMAKNLEHLTRILVQKNQLIEELVQRVKGLSAIVMTHASPSGGVQ